MRQLCAASVPSGAAVGLLSAFLVLAGTSCESLQQSLYGRQDVPAGDSSSQASPIAIDSWTTDWLNCARDRCERWYEVDLDAGGVLKVDLYAPAAPGDPDCELTLESPDGEPLIARTGRVRSRRQLRYDAAPGTYRLKVVSRGDNPATFDYEMHVRVGAGEKRAARKQTPKPAPQSAAKPARKPPPEIPVAVLEKEAEAPTPGREETATSAGIEPATETESAAAVVTAEPEPEWIVAEVLDVEEVDGQARNVMIEAGEPEGVERGMQGILVEGETEIGRVEVTDVYRNGSRARIVGVLSAPVSFDTLARIQAPPDGE